MPTDFEIDGIALGMEVVDVVDGQRGHVTGIAVYRFSTNTARVESSKDGKAQWVGHCQDRASRRPGHWAGQPRQQGPGVGALWRAKTEPRRLSRGW